MTAALKELNQEIINNLFELSGLTKIIKDLDAEMVKSETEETKIFLHETIERYKATVDKIKILLECYFAEERKEGLPADFSYRQVYRKLKYAY